MKSKHIIDATHTGIAKAKRKYEKWSGWREGNLKGAEYVATIYIAEAIQNLNRVGYVTVEQNFKKAIVSSGGSLAGRIGDKNEFGSRFDIAVWNKHERIKGLVEVKTTVTGFASSLERDFCKICKFLRRKSVRFVQWGLVAYFITLWGRTGKQAEEKLLDLTDNIELDAKEYVEHRGFSLKRDCRRVVVEDGAAWTSEVLEIRNPKRA
ncbi:MAG: hypothetical protein F4039_05540 [Gammaproteobacteria bacterium]|nr:hypothetical protein [Gammaproteobacteria bacterium]MYF52514.1 hypothetical protein [Gammaproteobacteria bacterium]MYK43530.1 hypothetical protein [Gammaproteobacteria bacterium]